MVEAEDAEAVGELVTVCVSLAQEEQQAGPQEVLRQAGAQCVWHGDPTLSRIRTRGKPIGASCFA